MKGKGFTLVEVLFVVVIIGILLGLLIPNAMKAITAAETRECAANIRAINTAIQMCMAEKRNATLCQDEANFGSYLPAGKTMATILCPITNAGYTVLAANPPDHPFPYVDETAHFATGNYPNSHE